MSLVSKIGMVAAIVMPLFNIPLICRMIKRKSSEDISLWWAVGVWVCIVLMAPSGFTSDDLVFKAFNISNVFLFTFVMIVAVKYRRREDGR
jgi:uncharacterized protein with PQ loop repeat